MWFCKVWAEWDGKIANKEKLDMKTTELLRYEREADAQQRALEREQVIRFFFFFLSSLCFFLFPFPFLFFLTQISPRRNCMVSRVKQEISKVYLSEKTISPTPKNSSTLILIVFLSLFFPGFLLPLFRATKDPPR